MALTVCAAPHIDLKAGNETDNPAYSGKNFMPRITNLTPFTVGSGTGAQTMHVYGAGFDATTKIRSNNVDLTTTLVNSGEVTASFTPPGAAGNVPVLVKNGTVTSGTIYVEVT